jgi:trehalose 6-phosphate phosphatase
MSPTRPESGLGSEAYEAILERPAQTLVAVDFDGTLAPITDDPEQAYADPRAVRALGRLGALVGRVVVITGRPARTAVRLGRFVQTPGLERLVVLGQYGVERWDASSGEYVLPPEPEAITEVAEELPGLLEDLGLSSVRLEHKGRAIGVHTRELRDPAAYRRLEAPLAELAGRHGLHLEPGKSVLEIRAPGIDKGDALRSIVTETDARQVIFAGDDLGDLPAFRAVEQLRTEGTEGLLICSASHEEDALTEISDLVLDGPSGVAAWLNAMAEQLEGGQPVGEVVR